MVILEFSSSSGCERAGTYGVAAPPEMRNHLVLRRRPAQGSRRRTRSEDTVSTTCEFLYSQLERSQTWSVRLEGVGVGELTTIVRASNVNPTRDIVPEERVFTGP